MAGSGARGARTPSGAGGRTGRGGRANGTGADAAGTRRRPAEPAAGDAAPKGDAGPAARDGNRGDAGAKGGAGADGAVAEGAAGPQLARAVLDAARSRRESAAKTRRRGSGGGESGGGERRLRGYSGPGPDPRDPQPLGAVLDRLMKARGWQQPAAEARVFGAWEKVVGAEVAQHSRPVKLEDGELTVEARSTAWATQLRLLAGSLLQQIGREVGHNVVRRLHIHGPAAPSWSRGPRRVRGRGPRDTYG